MNNADKPINPITSAGTHISYGLTKREYFAGLAMQAIVSLGGVDCMDKEAKARNSVRMADALLKELEGE